jgi:hypothetical protein
MEGIEKKEREEYIRIALKIIEDKINEIGGYLNSLYIKEVVFQALAFVFCLALICVSVENTIVTVVSAVIAVFLIITAIERICFCAGAMGVLKKGMEN